MQILNPSMLGVLQMAVACLLVALLPSPGEAMGGPMLKIKFGHGGGHGGGGNAAAILAAGIVVKLLHDLKKHQHKGFSGGGGLSVGDGHVHSMGHVHSIGQEHSIGYGQGMAQGHSIGYGQGMSQGHSMGPVQIMGHGYGLEGDLGDFHMGGGDSNGVYKDHGVEMGGGHGYGMGAGTEWVPTTAGNGMGYSFASHDEHLADYGYEPQAMPWTK